MVSVLYTVYLGLFPTCCNLRTRKSRNCSNSSGTWELPDSSKGLLKGSLRNPVRPMRILKEAKKRHPGRVSLSLTNLKAKLTALLKALLNVIQSLRGLKRRNRNPKLAMLRLLRNHGPHPRNWKSWNHHSLKFLLLRGLGDLNARNSMTGSWLKSRRWNSNLS